MLKSVFLVLREVTSVWRFSKDVTNFQCDLRFGPRPRLTVLSPVLQNSGLYPEYICTKPPLTNQSVLSPHLMLITFNVTQSLHFQPSPLPYLLKTTSPCSSVPAQVGWFLIFIKFYFAFHSFAYVPIRIVQ